MSVRTKGLGAILTLVTLLLVGSVACGSSSNSATGTEKLLGTPKAQDGHARPSGVRLPVGWPKNILFVPDGFEIARVWHTGPEFGNGTKMLLTGDSDSDVRTLGVQFHDAFENNGLAIEENSVSDSGGILSGAKEPYVYTVAIVPGAPGRRAEIEFEFAGGSTKTN